MHLIFSDFFAYPKYLLSNIDVISFLISYKYFSLQNPGGEILMLAAYHDSLTFKSTNEFAGLCKYSNYVFVAIILFQHS